MARAQRLRTILCMDFKNIDLQLLVHFNALISESHVTRAADKLNMSQPQMSAVLARLRQLFDDPLLIRTPTGMQPTPRALELLSEVRQAMSHLNAAFSGRAGFSPLDSVRTFHLAGADSLAKLFLPGLLQVFTHQAPGLKLTLRPAVPNRIRDWLEAGEVDLVFGYWTRLADGLHASTLFRQQLCVVASDPHPRIKGTLSLADYVAAQHIFFGAEQATASTLECSIDLALTRVGVRRDVAVRLPSLLLTPELVANSPLVATIPVRLARKFARVLPLQVLDLPFEVPRPDISMVWHERSHKDAGHQWLRQQLRTICEGLDGFPPGRDSSPGQGGRVDHSQIL